MKDNGTKVFFNSKTYLKKLNDEEPNIKHDMITWGDLELMEELVNLFGFDREKDINNNGIGGTHQRRFRYVMNKLDRESQQENAIFYKGYIGYNGIINRPTRCFTLKNEGGK